MQLRMASNSPFPCLSFLNVRTIYTDHYSQQTQLHLEPVPSYDRCLVLSCAVLRIGVWSLYMLGKRSFMELYISPACA